MGLLVDGAWRDVDMRAPGRPFRPQTDGLPQLHHRRRQRRPDRQRRLSRRSRPLSSLCFARLPVGAPHADFPQAEKARGVISVSVTRGAIRQARAGNSAPSRARRSIPSTANPTSPTSISLADPHYTGRASVPVLWDKKQRTIVNNESSEIIRMLNSAFDAFTDVRTDYYPPTLRGEIDRINDVVYNTVNNGVYRAGFATTQAAYEEAARAVFATLDQLEDAAVAPALSRRHADHRSRLAVVHHACSLRRGLLQPLQMQCAAHRRLSESLELSARSLPGAGRRRDRQPRSHQAALLRQPPQREPDRHRADRTAHRFHAPHDRGRFG